MAAYETRLSARDAPALRRRDEGLRVPRLAPLEVSALAVAVVMALGPLSAYAVGLGL